MSDHTSSQISKNPPSHLSKNKATSKELLARIAESLDRLGATQAEICERLGKLEAQGSSQNSPSASGAGRKETLRFLDQFRAGEALGESSLGAWLAVCQVDCVRGGLRTIQQREGMHARLLEARIAELGGQCEFEIPQSVQKQVTADAGATDKDDRAKLLDFVGRFPDVDAAIAPILDFADRLDGDPETQALLRTIAQDERATLEFTHEACALLNA